MPVSRAFPYISFRVTTKGAFLPGFPGRDPIERGFVSKAFYHMSLRDPGETSPLQLLQRGPYRDSCLFPEPSFTYLSESPANKVYL